MKKVYKLSEACKNLAVKNLALFPNSFICRWKRDPNNLKPSYLAIQEIFWASMLDFVDHLLDGPPLPNSLIVSKKMIKIDVEKDYWNVLIAEIGLQQDVIRQIVKEIFALQILYPERSKPSGFLKDIKQYEFSDKLLAFVLITAHLAKIFRNETIKNLSYNFQELSIIASRELAWAKLGQFDEAAIAKNFFAHAGIGINHSENLLKVAYHSYFQPLMNRLKKTKRKINITLAEEKSVPADLLMKTILPQKEQTETISSTMERSDHQISSIKQPAVDKDELRTELLKLRDENEKLRNLSFDSIIIDIFSPLLHSDDEPFDVLSKQFGEADGITGRLLYNLLAQIENPNFELFGQPGKNIHVRLPNIKYQLDDSIPDLKRELKSTKFCITKRGIRFKNKVILPAKIRPVFGGKK